MSKVITRIRSAVKSSLGFHETDRERLTKRLRDIGVPSLASHVARRCPADRWPAWTDAVAAAVDADPETWPAWTDQLSVAIPMEAVRTPADEPTAEASREWYSRGDSETELAEHEAELAALDAELDDDADEADDLLVNGDRIEPLHVWLDQQADYYEAVHEFGHCPHAHGIAKRFRVMADFARLRCIDDIN